MRIAVWTVVSGCVATFDREPPSQDNGGSLHREGDLRSPFVFDQSPGSWLSISAPRPSGLGKGVAGGDFDGDGFSDVVVTAETYTRGQLEEGAAFVFRGSPDGLGTQVAWSAQSNQLPESELGTRFGEAVASCDLNGDGFDDVVVGAPWYHGGQSREGALFAFHGGPDGLERHPSWRVESNEIDGYLGWFVTCADVTGDGFDDVVSSDAAVGRWVVAFFGSPAGPSAVPSWVDDIDVRYVRSAGDVNGDGFGDLTFDHGPYGVEVGLLLGTPSGPERVPSWTHEEFDDAGLSQLEVLAGAGDVNADGYDDLVAGGPDFDFGAGETGAAFLYLGSPTGPSSTADWSATLDLVPDAVGPYFGHAAAGIGDVNGDGLDDVAIGAYRLELAHTKSVNDEGAVFVYTGTEDGLSAAPHRVLHSGTRNAYMGFTVAAGGDVDADGLDELVTGGGVGTAWVVQGTP